MTPHRRAAALAALALTLSLPTMAQGTTGDTFLDAMLSEQEAPQTAPAAPAAAPAAEPRAAAQPAAAAEESAAQAPAQTYLVSAAADTQLVDDLVVLRELGPQTGIFAPRASTKGSASRA